jgi:plastocyanin
MNPGTAPKPLTLTAVLVLGFLCASDFSSAESEPFVLAVASDGVQRAHVALESYAYVPKHLVVRAGIPVELELKNGSLLTPHNFVLKDSAAGLSVSEDVSAGKTKTVRFTAAQPGSYAFYCDKKLLFFASHREKGMEGRLEVR